MKSSFIKILITFGVVVGVLVFFIFPTLKSLNQTEAEINALESTIDEHQRLSPLHQSLKQQIKTLQTEVIQAEGEKFIEQDQIPKLSKRFETLSRRYRMTFISGTPDIDSIDEKEMRLKFKLSVKGSYKNFQRLLKEISLQPFLEKMDRISVKLGEKKYIKEIEMDLWINLRGKKQ